MKIIIFIYGLLIGSFLNVCIYRIPINKSIVFPSSHCPKCKIDLKWIDLIPIYSFISSRGKCRYCEDKISSQYLLVELINSIVFILLYDKYEISIDFLFYSNIFSILIIIIFIDLEYMLIPDKLIYMIVGNTILYKIISYSIYGKEFNLVDSLLGLFLSALFFLFIIYFSKGGMGDGDLTLISSLGFIIGLRKIFLTIFLSFILGGAYGAYVLMKKFKKRNSAIAFGPFISLGFFITILWGENLINWYLNNFF